MVCELSLGSKKELGFRGGGGGGGCCGRPSLSIGGLDPKYELGQGKLDYFEPSLLCAALSRSFGSSVSV